MESIKSRFNLITNLVITALSVATSLSIRAEEKGKNDRLSEPLWEVGVGAATFHTPAYPAADTSQTNAIASPYFIYRGKILQIGDGSVARAVAINKNWYELDISLAGSFDANSEDNEARAGMKDLDFIFELGPQLKVRLLEFEQQGEGDLYLNLQTRAVFSTDFSSIEARGYVFQPELSFNQRGWLSERMEVTIDLSPTWASEKLHDYFYQVDSEYVTGQRSAYDAKSGYLGTGLSVDLSFYVTENIRIFTFGNASFHSNSANQNSPLFKQKNTFSYGVGVVWELWQSEERVW